MVQFTKTLSQKNQDANEVVNTMPGAQILCVIQLFSAKKNDINTPVIPKYQ